MTFVITLAADNRPCNLMIIARPHPDVIYVVHRKRAAVFKLQNFHRDCHGFTVDAQSDTVSVRICSVIADIQEFKHVIAIGTGVG